VEATLPFGSYHQIIVNGSFDNVTRVDEVYHHGGRGFPDVAAVGENQIVLWAGQWWTIGGTSLSAPLWGSMLTLINEPDAVWGTILERALLYCQDFEIPILYCEFWCILQ
jgi:subtilase family serine protease